MTRRTSNRRSSARARVRPNIFFFETPESGDPESRAEQLLQRSIAASESVINGNSSHILVADFFLAVSALTEAQFLVKRPTGALAQAFRDANERGAAAEARLTKLVSAGMGTR